jgi:predicted dehydrogenase
MDHNSRLRVGVIGVGVQGEQHLKCFRADGRVELAAACDRNADLLAQRQAQYEIAETFADYQEMYERADLDAVSIVLPDFLHREPTAAAFAAGLHVLLEKPMATSVEDAEAMLAAQRAAGKRFMINLSNRWMAPYPHAKASIERGELGEVRYVYARLSNTLHVPTSMLSWAGGSKLPHWLMVHRLDLARWLLGQEPVRVRALQQEGVLKGMGIDTPDLYQATVEFEGGAIGTFEHCWILPESLPYVVDSKFQLIGTKGCLNVDPLQTSYHHATTERYTTPGILFNDCLGIPSGHVRCALEHFATCCMEGREPLVTGEDGLALTRALCAVVDSAERGGEIIEIPGS